MATLGSASYPGPPAPQTPRLACGVDQFATEARLKKLRIGPEGKAKHHEINIVTAKAVAALAN